MAIHGLSPFGLARNKREEHEMELNVSKLYLSRNESAPRIGGFPRIFFRRPRDLWFTSADSSVRNA